MRKSDISIIKGQLWLLVSLATTTLGKTIPTKIAVISFAVLALTNILSGMIEGVKEDRLDNPIEK